MSDFHHEAYTKRDRLMVSEGGLYVLAARSKKEIAKKFTLWWSKEVLPTIGDHHRVSSLTQNFKNFCR
jgi:prophage antirepressor-like protein